MNAVQLSAWDWFFLVWFLAVTTGVGLFYTQRAGKNLAEYFLSGRNLPWWALGTSMVATTFAADTPLVVTGLVISKGISGNWLWWSFITGGTLTVFLFSRLWRRSRVVTEIELIAKRYSGKPASFLRGFKAVYLGLIVNAITFAWVTKAMGQVIEVVFDIQKAAALGILITLTLGYTLLSGLWGVVATDVLQFTMAMVGALILATLSVAKVGGLGTLVERISALEADVGQNFLSIFPTGWEAFTAAITVLVLVNWWAVYYPGQEPGGGGFIAQRMLAAQNERHARAGTLWFTLAHYVVRPWPWILVALSALALEPKFLNPALYGNSYQPEKAYPWMFHVLPVGLLGLVVASFFAAFMSTITSVLNLSSSYLMNDFYLPFLHKGKRNEKREVLLARLTVVLVTLVGCFISWRLESAGSGWQLVMQVTAGTGLVLILRWVWWRVNAWSEITALGVSTLICLVTYSDWGKSLLLGYVSADLLDTARLLTIVIGTSVVWVMVTLLTPAVNMDHLENFYREVRPLGFWKPLRQRTNITSLGARSDLCLWVFSTVLVFACLVSIGSLLLGHHKVALPAVTVTLIAGFLVHMGMRRETT